MTRTSADGCTLSSPDGRFSFDLRRQRVGVAVRRRSARAAVAAEFIVVVRTIHDFDALRSADPLRFEYHHEYEQAARRVRGLLDSSPDGGHGGRGAR